MAGAIPGVPHKIPRVASNSSAPATSAPRSGTKKSRISNGETKMSTSPVSPNPLATPTSASSSSSSSSSSAAQSSINALSDPNTFLQLLVAQLKYQDPESPADGTTFVTQLATFAGVQEQTQMRTDLDSIDAVAKQMAASQAAAASNSYPAGTPTGTNPAKTNSSN